MVAENPVRWRLWCVMRQRAAAGYSCAMTENSSEDTPDVGLIPDEELPEDLQPEKNPLAKNPDDESDDGDDGGEKPVEGMPDMGEPGASA